MTINHSFSTQWQDALADNSLLESAMPVLSGSDYVMQWGNRYPERAKQLLESEYKSYL